MTFFFYGLIWCWEWNSGPLMHQACAPLLSQPPLFSFISMTSMKFEIPCMAHIIVLMDSDSFGKLQTPDFSTKAHYILVFASSVALLLLWSASFLPTLPNCMCTPLTWHCRCSNPLTHCLLHCWFYTSSFFSSKCTCLPWVLISSCIKLRTDSRLLTVLPAEWFYNSASKKHTVAWTIQHPFVFSVSGRK